MADLDQHLPAIAAGDPDAFARWVAGAERQIRDSLRPLAARVDVESVLQESLLRVWQVAPRFVPDGRPNGLVRLGVRVARNLSLDELRRARVDPLDDAALERALHRDSAELALVSDGPDPLLRLRIAECRERLPSKPGLALTERLSSAGTEPDEVLAERLGMRLNTFLQNFTRARRLLAACLEERGVELGQVMP